MLKDLATVKETSPEALAVEVDRAAAAIDFSDPALTISYGAGTMNAIAGFADNLLRQVRGKDAGPVGEILTNLLIQVKAADAGQFAGEEGLLSRLPLVGSMFNSFERRMAGMKKITDQVDAVTASLDQAMVGLLRDIEILEQLFNSNRQFHQDLSVYIAAGEKRLEAARNTDLPRMLAEAEESGDSMKAQEVRDFAGRLDRFERRLHDLRISRTVTVQSVPQIRLIQNNDQILAEKIQTSILTNIPIWKNQMVLALSMYRQKKALGLQKQVSDSTNDLLRKNAEMLEDASLGVARESGRAVVDMETLREVHERLLSTIEESLKITAEGRTSRRNAERELREMEDNLRSSLLEIAAREKAPLPEQASLIQESKG
ncbi:MAG: toxic anion resistance protein [Desulfovibrionaceae bacterium]|nr:toxic anion resistance protein [Desulfovibrionaceae bacterium]